MQTITVQETFQLRQNEKITLIDVREEDEFAQAHIEGSQLAPLSNLIAAIDDTTIPEDNKIIVYCLKGGRSAKAIEFLSENMWRNRDVYNMEGGITEWAEQDLPLVHPNSP